MTEPLHQGHRQRLRQRFLDAPGVLPDYELLELLLGIAIPRRDVKPLAKTLLARFGDFASVISASPEALRACDGLGETSVATLKIVMEAGVRLVRHPVQQQTILTSWDALVDYCVARMSRQDTEQLRLLFLNNKNAVLADEMPQSGTVNHTPIYPREVVKRALELGAMGVVMVHNHPSGDPTPSRADVDMTRQIKTALQAVGITLHDHLVIGKGRVESLKARGVI